MQRRKRVLLCVCLLACLVCTRAAAQERKEVTFAILLDGPWSQNREIREAFEAEISKLFEGEFIPQFPEATRLVADWSSVGVRSNVDKAYADPKVDIVIALGPLSSAEVGLRQLLPKPTIAAFVIDPAAQGIPLVENRSGVKNLSYVTLGIDTVRQIQFFRKMFPFQKLVLFVAKGLYETTSHLRAEQDLLFRAMGIERVTVPVGSSAEEALDAIPPGTEAAYLTPLLELNEKEFQRLISGLIERRLPSFSLWGRSEVLQGVLAGVLLDLDFAKVARRVALNAQKIVLGNDPGEFPVSMERSERLTINVGTARAIGRFPSWAFLSEAELVNEEEEDITRHLSLASVAREALASNLDLAVVERQVNAGKYAVRQAYGEKLPQVEISGRSALIDGDRALAGFGSVARLTSSFSTSVRQLIYSEPVWASHQVEEHLQRTREERLNQLRLDIIRAATVNYVNVLRAKTAERIQKSNLNLTTSHLELANNRLRLGASGPGEVYRWETQIADNRRIVVAAIALRNQAEIALNRILNRPLEEAFRTQEVALDDPKLVSIVDDLEPYLGDPGAFDQFRNFMVREAISASPELKRADATIDARKRALLAAKRAFYVPDLFAQADVGLISRKGAGSDPGSIPLPPGIEFPFPGPVNWSLAVKGVLPIYAGGTRSAEVNRIDQELNALVVDRESVGLVIEERVRSNLHRAMSSHVGIALARAAADSAVKNLELITDSYRQGAINIVNLLDAQNQALQAELAAANAINDFLVDLMDVERSVGHFHFFGDPSVRKAFMDRIEAYYGEIGYPVRKP